MILLDIHDHTDDEPVLVQLAHVQHIRQDVGMLQFTMADGTVFQVPGRLLNLKAALAKVGAVTVLEL